MCLSNKSGKVLLLGWSGADLSIIQPLVDNGGMPNLESLMLNGLVGKLFAMPPAVSASHWMTTATGQQADRHGVVGSIMPDPDGKGTRPVNSTDLKAVPVWQLLNEAGVPAAAVNWPVTHPAHVFDGLVVSEAFAEARGKNFHEWPIRENAISDPCFNETLANLRLHPTEITKEQVLPFVPQAFKIDQETDGRLPLIVASLARAASVHGAGTWIAEHHDWSFLAVHFDLIERLSHACMQYCPPQMAHVSDRDFEIYQGVVDGAYRFMDMMLGRYLELLDEDTHIMVVSDHGFLTDHLRPIPNAGRGDVARKNYRDFGIITLSGPGVKKDELLFGATLLDVAPTVLTLLGQPRVKDMEGRVLTQAFETVPEQPKGQMTVKEKQTGSAWPGDPDWSQGRVAELVALGYLPIQSVDPVEAAEQATMEQLVNLAEVLIAKQEFKTAQSHLEQALDLWPDNYHARLKLAQCRFGLNDTKDCRRILDDLILSGLEGGIVDYLYGQVCAREGDFTTADEHLTRAAEKEGNNQRLLERIGDVQLQAKQWENAEKTFTRALKIDPEFAQAYRGLGNSQASQGNHETAVESFLQSLGLLYYQPLTHFYLGASLAALGRIDQAMEALKNALSIQPDFKNAAHLLKKLRIEKTKNIIALAADKDLKNNV